MIRSIFAILLILNTCTAFALQALPSNIIPLKGVLDLRYIPNFEASCTKTNTESKLLKILETSEVTKHDLTLYEDSLGDIKIKFRTDFPTGAMNITFDIKPDGTGLTESEPVFQFYDSKNSLTTEEVEGIKSILAPNFKKIFKEEIGTSVTQGKNIKASWCGLMNRTLNKDLRNFQTKFEDFSIKGISNIDDRDSLIISGTSICNGLFKDNITQMKVKGWYAIDTQSGLEAANHYEITFGTEDISITSRESITCDIKGSPVKKTNAKNLPLPKELINKSDKSASQRLTELKELFDKNLITKEIFEQKRNEIVNSL